MVKTSILKLTTRIGNIQVKKYKSDNKNLQFTSNMFNLIVTISKKENFKP